MTSQWRELRGRATSSKERGEPVKARLTDYKGVMDEDKCSGKASITKPGTKELCRKIGPLEGSLFPTSFFLKGERRGNKTGQKTRPLKNGEGRDRHM